MHLISASRRTDIPAFYAGWFARRLEAGFCHCLNPFNGSLREVSLRPGDCAGIVCWTRHAAPLLPSLARWRDEGHRFAFHYTINGYPRRIESHNPPVETALRTFRSLSDLLGPERVWWRYDPVLLTPETPPAWHLRNFARLARELSGYTARCYFSFVSVYHKTRRNLAAAGVTLLEPETEARRALAAELASEALKRGIRLYACCDPGLLQPGVEAARCVDIRAFEDGPQAELPSAPTRAGCGCVRSIDIGAYDTCPFGCGYCYATNSRRAALERRARHNPEDSLLWRPASLEGKILERAPGSQREPLSLASSQISSTSAKTIAVPAIGSHITAETPSHSAR